MVKRIKDILAAVICSLMTLGCSDEGIRGTGNKIFGETFTHSGDNFYLTRVLDGDTFSVTWLPGAEYKGRDMPVRIRGIDTPEIKGNCAYEKNAAKNAKEALENLLTPYARLSPKGIILYDIDYDKYSRLLAKVEVINESNEEIDIASEMLKQGHARPYNGGKRLGWCQDLAED
ncbi:MULTISPECIES: thermonuclease family protein [unclassified Oleiphilus]|uniref:thermonuclease family protein n=1 Tax=unclassified Oleiphilus TaxID=2631174 RepID=UPI0007C2B2C2|nr:MULTISPECIES: thermonuclease family protein [unclassified Oleiphilus]KZY65611.1 hypothetical protein A3738_08285 [Oleiphilus sp. HI0066]KZY71917.1 hypothetical protein A3739_03805 [Oleiphilus sp. HI0067]